MVQFLKGNVKVIRNNLKELELLSGLIISGMKVKLIFHNLMDKVLNIGLVTKLKLTSTKFIKAIGF